MELQRLKPTSINDKVKVVTKKICDTRAGVTTVKAFIDGMRSTRDTQMTEMTQLKARLKEQNQRLIQLTTDAVNQEQIQAAFSNKQIVIKQLKDKLEDICEQIINKHSDIDNYKEQLKRKLSGLM
uniref:CSON001910 protein n=1 Tax=Culicoides sonorensis TaxID=179676 RepID=A0A336L240_CULSO